MEQRQHRQNYLNNERNQPDNRTDRDFDNGPIRQWSGKPYRSKQFLLANLTAENGVGIQKLTFDQDRDGAINFKYFNIDGNYADIKDVARHDGLSFEDWREWFKDCDLSQPLAVIHFSKFRY